MLGALQGPLQQGLQSQNQQQQSNNMPQQGGQQQNNIPPPPPQNGQDFTLSSVLHFLQTEWRKYERDRNEWEIERAEMRARIALLEGERRSFENVKLDLMRRIKMLEYALRMERSKQLVQPSGQSIPPAKLAAIQAQTAASSDKGDTGSHKDGSNGSSPRSEDSPLPPEARIPNGVVASSSNGRPASWGGTNWPNGPTGGGQAALGKPPPGRDPKSRARSRDYLKQCLQEISYLTSPQAMNPLPNRPIFNGALPLQMPTVPSVGGGAAEVAYGRPRKVMQEAGKDFPLLNGALISGPSSAPASSGSQPQPLERSNPLVGPAINQAQQSQMPPQQQQSPQPPPQQVQQVQEQSQLLNSEVDKDGEEQKSRTMFFRPDNNSDWRERARLANEAEQSRQANASSWDRREDEDGKEEEGEVEDDDASVVDSGEGTKTWKTKRTLRNHLDAVRALAFHPTELCLATGGDDCTVKIWRMDVNSIASSGSRTSTEVEPQLTLRGHSAAITRLIHSASKQLLYSASLDSSIRVWALPSPSHTTYAPYDETCVRGVLIGHTDAVWDLALVRDESTLISCGSEGIVKVWDVSGPSGGGSLKLSWGYSGLENSDQVASDVDSPGATAVEAMKADLKKVAAAYQNAVVKIFDIETGKELSRLPSDLSYDGTPSTQISRIVSHPTMPILVTAHEDKFIRVFDIVTGQCTHSMLAHLDGVTSLSIDPSGFSLVSGSHDCSIRFWDLLGSKACVHEIPAHREKAREGVLDVEFHSTLPFMASAGADGVVKLYASS
ncbi:hypothetical protein HWV62_13471 [Athelia sp. TMB]|nr:hypothetical protein HWV62_13471 [Athelia sp. TMB]